MPERISKPKLVEKLTKKWNGVYKNNTYLRMVEISKGNPLRGIENSSLEFKFPVTVITGANGTGKTTFLALSVLAFHAEEKPLVPLRNVEYFDFSYFFRSTAKDTHKSGICIKWKYTNNDEDCIEKGFQRWMRYIRNSGDPRRPRRGTEFVGISRITPAFEKKNYQNYFSGKYKYSENKHNDELRKYYSRIMRKPYDSVSELVYGNTGGMHALHSYNSTHTSFNAGAGEECLSYILGTLLRCPKGSIVSIEEIEIGLHPSTLPLLADVVLEIALERDLQVVITSHSPEFLRACPVESLVLAERSGRYVEFTNSPNVEYAITRIGGDSKKLACIVCEDAVAGGIITNVLPEKLRALCPVRGFGGKDELIDRAEVINKFDSNIKVVIVWDGEVSADKVSNAKNKNFLAGILPGGLEPEQYLLSKLQTVSGRDYLKNNYDLSDSLVDELLFSLASLTDHHDIPYVLADGVRLVDRKDFVLNDVIQFVVREFKDEFADIVSTVRLAVDAVG